MSVQFTYTIKSLSDLADMFDAKATEAQATINRCATKKLKEDYRVAASTWRVAAMVVRATKFEEAV